MIDNLHEIGIGGIGWDSYGLVHFMSKKLWIGNQSTTRIRGIGHDGYGLVYLFFSFSWGFHTNNQMEELSIYVDILKPFELGWKNIICEIGSMIHFILFNKGNSLISSSKIDIFIKNIFSLTPNFESISPIHSPKKYNKPIDCLDKWSFDMDTSWSDTKWAYIPSNTLKYFHHLIHNNQA